MAKLAFLGLGQMGAPMAARLIDAGHDVTVWNRTAARAEPLAGRGATVAPSPGDAGAGAEAAITMVSDPAALERVLFGPQGLAAAMEPGSAVIDMSTVGPGPIREAASRLPEGVSLLDAPVLGSTPAAEDGSLKVLVGGPREVYDRWREVLEVMGPTTYVGPTAAGAGMKLVANSALGVAIAGLGEALALADRFGLEQSQVLDILAGGSLGFAIQRTRGQIESGEFPARFKLSLAAKDLGLVDDTARGEGLDLRIARASRSWYEDADEAGRGEQDYPAVIPHIRGGG